MLNNYRKYSKRKTPETLSTTGHLDYRHADRLGMLRIPRCRGIRRMLAKKDIPARMQASTWNVFFTSAWLIATRIISLRTFLMS